jgi:hypothetical protein
MNKEAFSRLIELDILKLRKDSQNKENELQEKSFFYKVIQIKPGPVEEQGDLFLEITKSLYLSDLTTIDLSILGPKNYFVNEKDKTRANPVGYIQLIGQLQDLVRKTKEVEPKVEVQFDATHPDVIEALEAAKQNTSLQVSLYLSDKFLQAVVNNSIISQKMYTNSKGLKVSARELFHMLTHQLKYYKNFRVSFNKDKGKRVQVLDLSKFSKIRHANWVELKKEIKSFDSQKNSALHLEGWSKLISKLGIPYNSRRAEKLAASLTSFVSNNAKEKGLSVEVSHLAQLKGVQALENLNNNKDFERRTRLQGTYSLSLISSLTKNSSIQTLNLPRAIKQVFKTTKDLTIEQQIYMVKPFIENCSGPVNFNLQLQKGDNVGEIRRAILLSWQNKCNSVRIKK